METEPIQNFIGSLPGCGDIPELFDSVLRVGLYEPESIWLCQGPKVVSPANTADAPLPVQSEYHALGACVNTLEGKIKDLSPFEVFPSKENIPGATVVKGGVSWRVLDSASDVIDQIVALTPMGTSLGTNLRCVPRYFYDLTLAHRTVTVVLQWSTDTIRFGKALDPRVDSQEHASSLSNDLVQVLNKAFEDWKGAWEADLTTTESRKILTTQTNDVKIHLSTLVEEVKKNCDTSFYNWMLKLRESFAAKQSHIQPSLDKEPADPEGLKVLKITSLPEMGENVRDVLDSVQQTPAPFRMTAAALAVLRVVNSSAGAGTFVKNYGHTFIDSYTEAGKLSAIWSLTVKEKTTEEDWMSVRVLINQYFAAARSVNDVCDFFASGVHSYLSKNVDKIEFDVKTTVFGYRSMTSSKPRVLQNLDPRQAKYYLTPEALARNRVQTSYHLQPFQGLPTSFQDDSLEAKSFKALTHPHPDQTFILSLQDMQRKLFILNAFSKTSTGVNILKDLPGLWSRFDDFQESSIMDADGNIKSEKASAMGSFEEKLQKRIFEAEEALRETSTASPRDALGAQSSSAAQDSAKSL